MACGLSAGDQSSGLLAVIGLVWSFPGISREDLWTLPQNSGPTYSEPSTASQTADRIKRCGAVHLGVGIHLAGNDKSRCYDGHCRPFRA
jgi:hypothetical protein